MSNAVWEFLRIETKDNCGEAGAILLRKSQCNRSRYDCKDLYMKTQSSSTLDASDPNLKTYFGECASFMKVPRGKF